MSEALTLPTEKSQPIYDLNRLTTLLYGLPKIGKTTWAAGADSALFLATEEGQNHVEVFKREVPDWPTFCAYCQLIGSGNHNFKTIVIDTIDNLYDKCVTYVNQQNGIVHENDMGYGKGYSLIYREFVSWLTWLSLQPYGLIMLSHARQMEVKTPTGTVVKYTCSLPDSPKNSIKLAVYKMSDLFLFAELEEVYDDTGKIISYDRVVRTQPTTIYEAGDRTGRLPETLPLNYDAFAYYIMGNAVEPVSSEEIGKESVPIDDSYNPYESE